MKERFLVASSCDNGKGLYILDLENIDKGWNQTYSGHGVDIIKLGLQFYVFFEDCCRLYKRNNDSIEFISQKPLSLGGHHGSCWDVNKYRFAITNSNESKIHWYDKDMNGEKTHQVSLGHLNDIFWTKDGYLLSSFSEGISRLSLDLSTVKHLYPGDKSHSVMLVGEDIWWCNSNLGHVMKNGEVWKDIGGFSRGLYFGDDGFIVIGVCNHKYNGSGNAGVHLRRDHDASWEKFELPKDIKNVFQVSAI
jgi:hypothetical protein